MQSPESMKQALERSTKAVTIRPAIGQYTHKNTAVIENGTRCRVQEKKFDFFVDVPPSVGGGGAGPTPGAFVRSALTSCVAIGIKLWAARAELPVNFVEVRLEADVDARGELGVDDDIAPGFLDMTLIIDVQSPSPPEEVEAVINRSLKYSPLLDVFSNEQKIRMRFNVKKPSARPDLKGELNG